MQMKKAVSLLLTLVLLLGVFAGARRFAVVLLKMEEFCKRNPRTLCTFSPKYTNPQKQHLRNC